MSQKVPVGPTINEAFRFGLERWGALLRFAWAPLLASGALGVLFVSMTMNREALAAAETGGGLPEGGIAALFTAPLPVVFAGGVALSLLVTLLLSGALASLFRLVALGEDRPGLFHFRLDGPAIRVFFALLILGLIGLMVFSASLFAASIVTGEPIGPALEAAGRLYSAMLTMKPGDAPPMADVEALSQTLAPFSLGALFSIIPSIYINVKLAPFPAGSAAENRLLLFGSFAMTFGHFWSILGVYVLFFIALILLAVVFSLGTGALDLLAQFASGQGGALGAMGLVIGFVVFAASVWFQLFVTAVQYSIPAILYRRLKTGD